MASFLEADVGVSWRWLGHSAFTELVALHPVYRPGKENYEHNKSHNAFPRTGYATAEREIVAFVRAHHGARMVCYGLNERLKAFANERGYPRGAKEEEIIASKTLLIDIDLEAKAISDAHQQAVERFLSEADDYFQDIGLHKPVRAFTGRGYHLLFAYPGISVVDCPDIAARQRKYAEEFKEGYRQELATLEARVDATHDLRCMVKIYGTAKPEIGIVSRFYGHERVEDGELRTYLLGMALGHAKDKAEARRQNSPVYGPALISVKNELPQIFLTLLKRDEKLRQLWDGTGKPKDSDTSGSGYDFSLARRLLACGVSDVSDIATVLALRPDGSYRKAGKGEEYLRRTIARALYSS